jgi:hypothetical protein
MAKREEQDSLYFINCLRALPIWPLGEDNPDNWTSLAPITQGPNKERHCVRDETADLYIRLASGQVEEEEDLTGWDEIKRGAA